MEEGVRVTTLLRELLGLCSTLVIVAWELPARSAGDRPHLVLRVRRRSCVRGRCGICGEVSPWFDRGGGERSWRHLDVGYSTCEIVCEARRVSCKTHGPTVAQLPFARHDSAFTRDFEDLVVYEAIASSKQRAAERYCISWRAVNNACVRVATEALGRVDLLSGLIAIAIDEVKYKKGQRYLTVVCDHFTGKVVWAATGRSKETVAAFFAALGPERSAALQFVTADGAEWIRSVVAERAPEAVVCLDTFHLVSWANDALDLVRRSEWNKLRSTGSSKSAKSVKGLRFLLLRNWENLTARQKGVIRDLGKANTRSFRAWQLKEELREIMSMPLAKARRALDDWLHFASRSRLEPFVKLARTVRHYRESIEATIEWKLTNGISESNNASIGRLRANARGFHDPQSFITMIMLDRAGIAPSLPWVG
jgi:transposase